MKETTRIINIKSLVLVIIMIFTILAYSFSLTGCSNNSANTEEEQTTPTEEPSDTANEPSNPYLEQINTDAQSVNVQLPWSAGVNFVEWFDATSPSRINFLRYSEQDFIDAKSMGIEVIRVPVRFHDMTDGAPHYVLDSGFLSKLDIALDWAEKHELYIILDNHSWSPTEPTDESIAEILIPVWRQVAMRYKDRSEYIIYELKNEPHGISSVLWSDIQGQALAEVKEIDPSRSVIVTGAEFGGIAGMANLPIYPYQNIIYTFHFYDPYIFTHQGETWSTPPRITAIENLPFPADVREIPPLAEELEGTWIEQTYNNYQNDATVEALERNLDYAVAFANENNVPIFCGEFGVHMPNVLQEDRVRWYEITVRLMEIRAISRTSWDYYGSFGIYKDSGIASTVPREINTQIVKALGFTPLEQSSEPITGSFALYDGLPNTRLAWYNFYNSTLDIYALSASKYAFEWSSVIRYGLMEINFRQEIDWQALADEGYSLSLRLKAQGQADFQVRFINSEIDNLLPWRIVIDIQQNDADGWVDIIVPLAQMQPSGAWIDSEGEWVLPGERGVFDWNRVIAMQIVAERTSQVDYKVQFEYIKITKG